MLRNLLERVGLLAAAVCCFLVLRSWGGFAESEAALLAIAFTLVGLWLYYLFTIGTFEPYRLVVGIDHEALLKALGLQAAGARFENLTFCALTASVFARSDHQAFSKELSFQVDIPLSSPAWSSEVGELRSIPAFFLRPAIGGHEFGIKVQMRWWEAQKEFLTPELQRLPITSNGELIIGKLPSGYIPDHVRRWNRSISFFYPFKRKQAKWEKELAREGWSLAENCPQTLLHRFVILSFSDL